jgi:pimeloyl-ACP methyl ester carboxylesterase
MNKEAEYALLAAGSYDDIRKVNQTDERLTNRAPIPPGWTELTQFAISGSGGASPSGFSAKVYKSTSGEVVISYAGTEFGGSTDGTLSDFMSGNIPSVLGQRGQQMLQAAALYQQVRAVQGSNITFTGHSLGGGIASVMAVWFNQPAVVFAPAPFQACADDTQTKAAVFVGVTGPFDVPADQIRILPITKAALLAGTAAGYGALDPSLASYNPITDSIGANKM